MTYNLTKEQLEQMIGNETMTSTFSNYGQTVTTTTGTFYTINTGFGTGGGSGGSTITWPYTSNYNFTSAGIKQNNTTLQVNGEGADLLINGKSLKTFMEKVEERLLILQPDPKLLEKYEALRNAYEYYKTMEALITKQEKKD